MVHCVSEYSSLTGRCKLFVAFAEHHLLSSLASLVLLVSTPATNQLCVARSRHFVISVHSARPLMTHVKSGCFLSWLCINFMSRERVITTVDPVTPFHSNLLWLFLVQGHSSCWCVSLRRIGHLPRHTVNNWQQNSSLWVIRDASSATKKFLNYGKVIFTLSLQDIHSCC